MDYEKEYKGALERAKKLYEQGTITESLSYVFPQLKKLGDEEARKEIMQLIQGMHDADPRKERWLAWLEKQGEQNLIMAKSPQLGKQKPANNNELKFKVGDWVVVDGITQKVTHIQTDGFDTDRAWNGKSTFKDVHLWTIADVKDCDVLVDVYGNVGIYKSHDDFSWLSYCSLGYYGGFQYFTIEHDNEKTYPATKEQRDLLFQKIHEAGYEWDSETKELKKISQRIISAEAKEAMYGNPAWSEEDTFMYNKIRNLLTDISLAPESRNSLFDWLESLRPQPKQR